MVPPYSHRVSRVRRYSGYRWLFRLFVYRTLTFFGWTSHSIPLNLYNAVFCPNPESITTLGLASSAFARHYLRNLGWFLFLALLRCFSSGGSPPYAMYSRMDAWTTSCGLLHSEICGSMLAYNSPQLIAVNHVLHRLPMPRHSLCALFCFTICSLVLLLRIFASLLIVVFVTTIDYRCIWLTHSIFLLSFYSVFKLHFLCPFSKNRYQ